MAIKHEEENSSGTSKKHDKKVLDKVENNDNQNGFGKGPFGQEQYNDETIFF